MPPLLLGLDERGQAPLPDLFYSQLILFFLTCSLSSFSSIVHTYLNAKFFLYKSRFQVAGIIAKNEKQEYTPALTCPPSQKVSQVEIEAGDSEGRLPHLFLA